MNPADYFGYRTPISRAWRRYNIDPNETIFPLPDQRLGPAQGLAGSRAPRDPRCGALHHRARYRGPAHRGYGPVCGVTRGWWLFVHEMTRLVYPESDEGWYLCGRGVLQYAPTDWRLSVA